MKYTLIKSYKKPIFYSRNNIISKTNDEFINFIGYSESELIGKSLSEIHSMLRMDLYANLENLEDKHSCYIFTKRMEVREVIISCKTLDNKNERVYTFKEKAQSRIEDRFMYLKQLCYDNKIGVAILSFPDFIMLKVNEKMLNYFYRCNETGNILGKRLNEIVSKYEWNTIEKYLFNVIEAGKSNYQSEVKYMNLKGGISYLDIRLVPIYKEGKLKYLISTIYDVTEKVLNRKIIESQARVISEQKEELEAIIDNISDGVIICDKDGRYIMCNKTLRNSYLYKFDKEITPDIIYKKAKYFDKDGNRISKEKLPSKRVLAGEKLSGYRIDIKNDNGVACKEESGTPIYDSKGNLAYAVLIVRDITERVQNEENLLIKAQYDVLNNLIENFALGYIKISLTDLKIKYINAKTYNYLKLIYYNGNLPESIVEENYFGVFKYNKKDREKFKVGIQNLIDKKIESFSICKKIVTPEEERFFRLVFQPIFGLNNQITELTRIAIDITEEVKAKKKMEEALKVQDEIFSNIAHELKTPLNVIFSTNQLIELYLKEDCPNENKKKVLKCINMIKQNCYRFTRLINNIVDLSKIESGFFKLNLANKNIVQVTEDIVQSVAEYVKSKGLNIVFDTNTEEKIIACDTDKIERIILNLISNAIKFTNVNGSIYVGLLDKGDNIEISVKDTGIGVDKAELNNIFKRFHQVDKSLSRNAEGSGIGLSLVKSIAEMHGGNVSVESEVGKGSIFKIELPSRIVKNDENLNGLKPIKSKIEMINIEFSDIYSIN